MAESMQGLKRTCRCAEVTKEQIGDTVTLMGWVQKARNKGGIIFVDLRDRSGIMQLIFENGEIDEDGFEKAGRLRSEFVMAVTGWWQPVPALSMRIWPRESWRSAVRACAFSPSRRRRPLRWRRIQRPGMKYVCGTVSWICAARISSVI